MSTILESCLLGHPRQFSYENIKRIGNQMENCVCSVRCVQEQATGFFTKITVSSINKIISVLILCNHIHDKNLKGDETFTLNIKSENDLKKIKIKERKYYTSVKYDTTIIELKESDNINHFLELDEKFTTQKYINETLYILHYPGGDLSVSFGTLSNIYEDKPYLFQHLCCTQEGSSGGPIIKADNKLIGIHQGGFKIKEKGREENYNLGVFLNEPIEEFIKQKYKKSRENREETVVDKDNKDKVINEIDISQNVLNLSKMNINDEELEKISKKKFKNLKNLILDSNNINNITSLKNFEFGNTLEELNLNIIKK